MRALLTGLVPLAVITFAAAPAAALDPPTAIFAASSAHGVTVHHGLPPQFRNTISDGADWGNGLDRRRRQGDSILIYDRDYQGDTAWRANSYNDWWHDRPERSFPRWMANNQNCQRMWWSGGGWRC